MVVFTTDAGEFRRVAERIADERGDRLTADLDDAIEASEPVLYVDAPGSMTERRLEALQGRLLERTPVGGAFGAVTGMTPESAASLYRGDGSRDGTDALVSAALPDVTTDEATTVLGGDRATAANLEELSADRLRSLSLHATGWPFHLNLADGYICGYPASGELGSFPGPDPFCAGEDGMECPVDGDLVFAEEIDAAHVFLVSCATVVDNATTGRPVHVGLQMLEGVDSLIGAYRLGASLPHELLLHHSLLRSGYTLAERCYLLNRNSHANGIMYRPYVPFGRPDAAIESPYADDFEYAVEPGAPTRLRLADVDAYAVDLRLPLAELPETDGRYYVRHRTPERLENPLKYAAFREGDDLRLVVYTGGPMRAERLDLDVAAERAAQPDRDVAFASAANARRNRSLNVVDSEVTDQVRGLWEQTRGVPEETGPEKYDADAHREVADAVAQLTGNADVIRDRLVELLDDGSYLMYRYANRAVDDDVLRADDPCRNCDRPVYLKQVSDGHGAYRSIGMCPRCGYRYDVPTEPGDGSPRRPTVRVGDADDGEHPITVEFDNATERYADVTAFLSLRAIGTTGPDGRALFEPERVDTRAAPGATVSAAFTFRSDRIYENQHILVAHVVANLEVYSAMEVVPTGDAAGYLAPRHVS